ncbi:type II secretion system protein [Campylobacter sp. 19-13652]|uniref:type II secretion system protein n=1 Tax=Campylobacter sp. 19-13652 TaxID=2840180 RepID=UPI001C76BD9E|nr:type II secretion system protein [Campylobacter sp. 19-13652]BCX79718.1 hypothetical protein LBC_11800 [Campylobacter sp. 19-13652]
MNFDGLLTQLGYNDDENTKELLKQVFNATNGLSVDSVVALNDHLKPLGAYVALSGSEPRLKIKLPSGETGDEAADVAVAWASKNKLGLRLINESTYYIIGRTE